MVSNAKRRGAARILGLAAASVGALALTSLAITRALDAASVREPNVDLDGIQMQVTALDALRTRSPSLSEKHIAFLGDSTGMLVPNRYLGIDYQLGPILNALAPDRPPSRLFSFALPGYTQFTQYFLSHPVARNEPDAVVLGFNLFSFSNQWRRADRPELAAWIPVNRLIEAVGLPLHWIGLSTDELLLYTSVSHLGALPAWRWLTLQQARCVLAWGSVAEWLQARSGAPTGMGYQSQLFYHRHQEHHVAGSPDRETLALAHARLDPLLAGVGPDHPVLRVLRATLEVFRERGIPVFVYITPVNVEHFDRIGLQAREGLRRGVESVRSVVLAGGASLTDLHDLLPDAAFADNGGHLVSNETLDAPRLAATRIAQTMLAPDGAR